MCALVLTNGSTTIPTWAREQAAPDCPGLQVTSAGERHGKCRTVSWLLLLAGLILVVLLLYWLLITTEGTYLGARVVAKLYDWVAVRYDVIKQFDPRFENVFVVEPAIAALEGLKKPLVLDVATGTGRVPALLLAADAFEGRLIGLDYSRKMLQQATRKSPLQSGRVALVWRDAMDLPFCNDTFDLVTCLEALEFMPSPERVLAESIRVIRPGGMLLISHRRGLESKLMPGKCWSESRFRDILSTLGMERVQLVPWQADYSLAWGWKPAAGPETWLAASRREADDQLEQLLRCPACGDRPLLREDTALCCQACHSEYPVAADGIIEMP